jgi:hypothetical protein
MQRFSAAAGYHAVGHGLVGGSRDSSRRREKGGLRRTLVLCVGRPSGGCARAIRATGARAPVSDGFL